MPPANTSPISGIEAISPAGAPGPTGAACNLTYLGSLLDYVGHLERWRKEPDFTGVRVVRVG